MIFLYMDGGPSQVDTFDYKPILEKYHGQDPRTVIGALAPTQFDNVGKILKNQWAFKNTARPGIGSARSFLILPRWRMTWPW